MHARARRRTRSARFAIRSTSPRSISPSCPRSIASCACSRTSGRNLFALHDARLRRRRATARALAELLAANGLPAPHARGSSRTCASLGYVFNPVSFFLDYDARRRARRRSIAEVNNTYGGRRRYVLGPARRADRGATAIGFRHVRELFVSPFLHGPASYEFWFDAPLDGAALDDRDARRTHARPRAIVHRAARRRRAAAHGSRARRRGAALPADDRAGDRPHPLRGAQAAAARRARTAGPAPITARSPRSDRRRSQYRSTLAVPCARCRRPSLIPLIVPLPRLRRPPAGARAALARARPAARDLDRRPPRSACCRRASASRLGGTGPAEARARIHDDRVFLRLLLRGEMGAGESFVAGEWSSDDLVGVLRLFLRATGARGVESPLTRLAQLPALAAPPPRREHAARQRAQHPRALRSRQRVLSAVPRRRHAGVLVRRLARRRPRSPTRSARSSIGCAICSRCRRAITCSRSAAAGAAWRSTRRAPAAAASPRSPCRASSTSSRASASPRPALADRVDDPASRLPRVSTAATTRSCRSRCSRRSATSTCRATSRSARALLAPGGRLALQTITMPDDRFDAYRRRVDWMQTYVFPGSLIPSLAAIRGRRADGSTLDARRRHRPRLRAHAARLARAVRRRAAGGARARLRRAVRPHLAAVPRVQRGRVRRAHARRSPARCSRRRA